MFSPIESSKDSLGNDLAEFLPEELSQEAAAALAVPLTSQDPPEFEEHIQRMEKKKRVTKKQKILNETRVTAGKLIYSLTFHI